MSFQWLQMRIAEEKDRRRREAELLERLPRAMKEIHDALSLCIGNYTSEFGNEAAAITLGPTSISVVVRDEREGAWKDTAAVEVIVVPTLPGFQVERPGQPLLIELGLLPGDRLCYRDREMDQYLTMDEVTRRILDRVMFPKLKD